MQDSTDMASKKRSVSSVAPYIIPATLLSYGTAEAIVMNKGRMLNYAIGHEVITHKPITIGIDDYKQYVPAASVLALNLCGVKSRHSIKDQAMLLGLSSLLTAISVNGLKYTVREMRPNGSRRNSFPSGHTTVSFMGAELLWQEYKDTSPWIGISGYVMAAGTGALRVYNNKHWVGDVALEPDWVFYAANWHTSYMYRFHARCSISRPNRQPLSIRFTTDNKEDWH